MISEAFSSLCPHTSAWLRINAAIPTIKDPGKYHYLVITRLRCKHHFWYNLLYHSCPTQKNSQCFLITNQTEYKIIILSFKMINNHASPLFPSMSLHIPYIPSKPNFHHSPNVSHVLPHPSLFSGCSLYLESFPHFFNVQTHTNSSRLHSNMNSTYFLSIPGKARSFSEL